MMCQPLHRPGRCWKISDAPAQRALVLGGTGHIGSAIARRLERAGYSVTATGKRSGDRPNLHGTKAQVVLGDDTAAGVVEHWCADVDLVVDAATPYPIWLHDTAPDNSVAVALARTRRVLDATAKAGAAFVHISSFTTLPRQHSPLSQVGQGMLRGMHKYFDVKLQVEKTVKEALGGGVQGCIVNPATCFGPYDLKPAEQAFIPMLLAGKVGGMVRHEVNVIDVRDVADIVVMACEMAFPHRQIPAFGHTIDLTHLSDLICQIGAVAPPRLQVPPLFGLAGLYWMETALAIAGRKTPWPSLPMMLVSASYPASPSPEQSALLGQLRPLDTTLQDAVAWYRQISRLSR